MGRNKWPKRLYYWPDFIALHDRAFDNIIEIELITEKEDIAYYEEMGKGKVKIYKEDIDAKNYFTTPIKASEKRAQVLNEYITTYRKMLGVSLKTLLGEN